MKIYNGDISPKNNKTEIRLSGENFFGGGGENVVLWKIIFRDFGAKNKLGLF